MYQHPGAYLRSILCKWQNVLLEGWEGAPGLKIVTVTVDSREVHLL